jgi:hypothetical protein
VKREVDETGEFITNWRLPEATESESLESLEELGEMLANGVVGTSGESVGQKYAARTHQAGHLQ